MLAPCSNRKRETAATIPGPSGQEIKQARRVVGAATGVRAEVGHQWLTAAAASSETSLSS